MEVYVMGGEIAVIGLLAYFLPTLIGLLRGHHNTFAIFLTNLLLGWTFIGWIIAFMVSLSAS